MKISEGIEKLTSLLKEHGDIEMYVNVDDDLHSIAEIYFDKYLDENDVAYRYVEINIGG